MVDNGSRKDAPCRAAVGRKRGRLLRNDAVAGDQPVQREAVERERRDGEGTKVKLQKTTATIIDRCIGAKRRSAFDDTVPTRRKTCSPSAVAEQLGATMMNSQV